MKPISPSATAQRSTACARSSYRSIFWDLDAATDPAALGAGHAGQVDVAELRLVVKEPHTSDWTIPAPASARLALGATPGVLRPDDMLGRHYAITGVLSCGANATIYAGRDRQHDRDVTIKMLATHHHGDLTAAYRQHREARIFAKLDYPAFPTVYDIGRGYVVKERIHGRTLADLLAGVGPLALSSALSITFALLDAAAVLHTNRLGHRDFQLDTVMLTPPPRPQLRVLDFPVAQHAAHRITMIGSRPGTLATAAPEPLHDVAQADARADVFAIGAVLYELLTGWPIVEGASIEEIAARLLADENVRSAVTRRPDVPRAIDDVLMRALADDPGERFPSATAMRAALAAAAGDIA